MSGQATADDLKRMRTGTVVYVGASVTTGTPHKRVAGGWKRFDLCTFGTVGPLKSSKEIARLGAWS